MRSAGLTLQTKPATGNTPHRSIVTTFGLAEDSKAGSGVVTVKPLDKIAGCTFIINKIFKR